MKQLEISKSIDISKQALILALSEASVIYGKNIETAETSEEINDLADTVMDDKKTMSRDDVRIALDKNGFYLKDVIELKTA